ncbi:hypothetical protein [Undibacterium sp. Ji22W]|uniref:hypothetical protein n=1 Tax=Undibacterium sp. Ji22W TaxID=3413038 RepID=UPI003BF21414
MQKVHWLNWFDAFMVIFALLPFAYMWVASSSAWKAHIPLVLDLMLYLVFAAGIVGFPVASVLYFVWRFRSAREKPLGPNSRLDTDGKAAGQFSA